MIHDGHVFEVGDVLEDVEGVPGEVVKIQGKNIFVHWRDRGPLGELRYPEAKVRSAFWLASNDHKWTNGDLGFLDNSGFDDVVIDLRVPHEDLEEFALFLLRVAMGRAM